MLTIERWQLDCNHHLKDQDFWLQQVHTLIIVQQLEFGHKIIY
jgi:hypothetical protein